MIAPTDEAGVAEAVRAAREPLAIEGNGSKRGLLRPVQAAQVLSTRNLTGITLYKPAELVLSARAGTPIPEIEAALAEHGQHIISEPPDTSALFGSDLPATLGGIVATNLSGPRRISWGAMRDHVLGVRFVNGQGEVLRSGGRVLKNVTGLDLSKFLSGSHGTLGILTEVTIKVLPGPETSATVAVPVADVAAGVRVLSAGLGSPFGVSAAAVLPQGFGDLASPVALLRIEDFAPSVAYRATKLASDFPGASVIEAEASRHLWRAIRDAEPLAAQPGQAIWRVSARPTEGPRLVAALPGFSALLDWGGGLVWLAGEGSEANHRAVMAAAAASRASFTLFRGPEALRAALPVITPDQPALAAIGARVKAVLDPAGLFNPGRMRAGV
ncbi:FAD-binding protein [Humitalea sp. 24SJ18S-53]|uniref:FAD-binding protein n=1 Tax=Humitalea sp. 24SJ18S-53 TaxID=3422307 RepID=UPI003D67E6DC